jgi:spore coat protein A
MVNRRDFLKYTGVVGAGLVFAGRYGPLVAEPAIAGLSDPALQPKFRWLVPNALDPAFKYAPYPAGHPHAGQHGVFLRAGMHQAGLINPRSGRALTTPIWGYGDERGPTWPGRTFEVQSGSSSTLVRWTNELFNEDHLLPVDTSLHWCYSLAGYTQYSIKQNGVPTVTHLHGGHSDFQYDGNPEFFCSPDGEIVGPQWANVPGGFTRVFEYDNEVPAGNLWYHDHALGITRLNVYAGLAGFYFVRDALDTGLAGNPLGLPAFPYELAYAIQDRMFTDKGELFYPAYPGDPFYDDFITGEGAVLPPDLFRGGGPTALAEFFGDHMVVNGIIWPKTDVEPRNYRMHLLNGTDSRFMALQLFEVPPGAEDFSGAIQQLPFTVVGSDQGLASSPTVVNTLLSEPGSRYDVIVDFTAVASGNRVIMKNIGGDEPFGGDIPGPAGFEYTDRVMAFDVVLPYAGGDVDLTAGWAGYGFGPNVSPIVDRTRNVALFEGTDEFGRLQPLLGTAEPATDWNGQPINWPNEPAYVNAGLVGQMEGSIAWHSPTTENPKLGDVEEWRIWNVTGDAHPIHLHLVHFEIVGRYEIEWDSETEEHERVIDPDDTPAGDGTYLVEQPVVQHNGLLGNGFRIVNPTEGAQVNPGDLPEYVENAPKDMVTALPGQVTVIRAKFDKEGRYVWHCHILSHEDHEMMRVLRVTPETVV